MIYFINNTSSINLGYGLHSQMQPINVYFLESSDNQGKKTFNNKNLDFTKSHHWVLGYNIKPIKDWRIKAEVYYQSIFQVPITRYSSSYSMLNTGATFKPDLTDSLANRGTGTNYGIELTIEKFFSHGFYGLLTYSKYNSTYRGSDGISRNTAFNGKYVMNFLTGKEWRLGVQKQNRLSLDLKCTQAGGRAYTPIDLGASIISGHEVLASEAYSAFYDKYFRMDLKIGFTINSTTKKIAHSLSLDLQNITNHQNVFSNSYDNRRQSIDTTYQLGFFPNAIYKIQF